MEPKQLEQLQAKLEARRQELVRLGDEAISPNRRDPSQTPDEDEQPLNEMNQVIASRRNKARRLELERIDQALRRIERDPEEFGECLECGEPIPRGRLELMPWALCCVRCQEARSPRRGGRRRHATDYMD